jgi:mRNA interferase MazF
MIYKIILAPFPFLEIDRSKLRPLLVISDFSETNTCIVGFITSKSITNLVQSDIVIEHNKEVEKMTGLVVDSVIRLNKIGTIDKASIVSEIGNLPQELESQLKQKLTKLFKL